MMGISLQSLRLQQTCSAAGTLRWFSVQSAVVDQMIAFARLECQDKLDNARDVLRQGLGMSEPIGADAGRLLLALADVEQQDSNWRRVAQLAQEAHKAAQSDEGDDPAKAVNVTLEAGQLETRARLILGHDDAAAVRLADQERSAMQGVFIKPSDPQRRQQALVLSHSNLAAALHAVGDMAGAAASTETAADMAAEAGEAAPDPNLPSRDLLFPAALQQIGAWRAAQGQSEEAAKLFDRAAAAGEANLEAARMDAAAVQSPVHAGDVVAGALLGRAQLALRGSMGDAAVAAAAEEQLSAAVAAAERVGGETHPRVATALLELGRLYAQTARVSFAEGLYREVAKRLRLDAAPEQAAAMGPAVHSSVASLLCWRYAQLLTALPKRTTEAGVWEGRAREYYRAAGGGFQAPINANFGDLDALKQGGGQQGAGAVLSLTLRRALPMALPS